MYGTLLQENFLVEMIFRSDLMYGSLLRDKKELLEGDIL